MKRERAKEAQWEWTASEEAAIDIVVESLERLGKVIGLDFDEVTLGGALDLLVEWIQDRAQELECDATFPAVLEAAKARGIELFPGALDVDLSRAEQQRARKLGLSAREFAAAKDARTVSSRSLSLRNQLNRRN